MGRDNEMIGVDGGFDATLDNRFLDHSHWVLGQQLQDTDVLPRSGDGAVTSLKVVPQTLEAGRQCPAIEHRGMIQGRRSPTENSQIVTGLDDPFTPRVASFVRGDDAVN